MAAALTNSERRFFEANGYLVIPRALSDEQLQRVREAADRAEHRWRADPSLPGGRGDNLEQIQAPIEYDAELCGLLTHPRVFPIIRELIGDDVMMIDNDYFITRPHSTSHAHWHRDVTLPGVYHPRSIMMVKAFYLLTTVPQGGGGTALLPGSHLDEADVTLPAVKDPAAMPGHVCMEQPAGTAYLFNGRILHAALNNRTASPRRALIYNYGHFWMKQWSGYEPSEKLRATAITPEMRQLLGIGNAYSATLSSVNG